MAYLPKSLRDRVARQQERARAESLVARRPREVAESEATARELNAPELKIPWNVRVWAAWSWRMLVILALVAAMVLLVAELKHVVIPILLAVILAVLLNPLAMWLRRVLRFPRAVAAIVTVLLVLTFLGGLVSVAGRSLYTGFTDLADKAGAGFQSLLEWLANGPLAIDQAQIDAWLKQLSTAVQDNSSALANGALSVTSSIGNIAAGSAVVLFLTIFFLMDGRAIWIWCVRLMPKTWRSSVHEASIRGWVTLRGYTKSTILVAFIDALGIGVGAAILGVPLALPLGLLVFVGSFIPIVGAFLTGTVAVLVALVDKGVVTALVMFGIVLAVQQIEGHILQPLIMGSSVSLHPVAVVLGVAGGTYVAGITGAVFTVPVMAFINTVALYLSGHDKFPRLATATNRPGGAPGTLDEQIRASYGYPTAVGIAEDEDLAEALPAREPGAAPGPSEQG